MASENRIRNMLDTGDGLAGGNQFDDVSKRRGIRRLSRLVMLVIRMFLWFAVTVIVQSLQLCRSNTLRAATLAIETRARQGSRRF